MMPANAGLKTVSWLPKEIVTFAEEAVAFSPFAKPVTFRSMSYEIPVSTPGPLNLANAGVAPIPLEGTNAPVVTVIEPVAASADRPETSNDAV